MVWQCWSDISATSQKSIKWAGEWSLFPLPGGMKEGGIQRLITAILPGPRSSSDSPRPCLPQRTPWKSDARAWVRALTCRDLGE